MIKLENILVATDFGDASESALSYGRALARNARGRVVALFDLVEENMAGFADADVDNLVHAH